MNTVPRTFLLPLCLVLAGVLPACLRSSVTNLGTAQVQDLALTAAMVPLAVPTNNLHTAEGYWLAAGDAVTIVGAQQYQFTLVDNDDPSNSFTCTFTPEGETCGGTVSTTPSGPPVFSVNILKCPGQTAACAADMGTIVQTFSFEHVVDLNGKQFQVGDEDATYFLEPTVDFHSGTPFRGAATAAMKVHVVPRNMQGRLFSAPLTFNLAQTVDKWQWPVEAAPWDENFGSSLQITTVTVQANGQDIEFCGIKAGSRICGCGGNLGASTVCSSVQLRQCSNFGGGAVTTPSYILASGPAEMLGSPDDRLQWVVRFQSCNLTPPDQNAEMKVNFNLIAR